MTADERAVPELLHGWNEIGKCLRISPEQARRWARLKLIPTFKNGRRVGAFRSSLLAALAKREAATNAAQEQQPR